MDKAYSYIRFSSKAQVDGRSLARQTEKAEEYARRHQLDLQDLSFQDLGVSGFRGKNASEGALSEFIDAVRAGHIQQGSWLLVENFDRFSRLPVSKALPLFLSLIEEGINVVTLSDEQVFKAGVDVYALMASLVQMERAHSESKRKSEHLSDVWKAKINKATEKPTKGRLPAWLTYNDPKTEILVDVDKAAVVSLIYQLSIAGMGRASIVRKFNDMKVPPIGKNTEKWHVSYVTKLLQTRAVLGEYHPHTKNAQGKSVPRQDPIKDYYPPIIDETTWFKAQAATASRRQGSTGSLNKDGVNKNLFSGFVKCECGSSMNLVSKGKGSKGGMYLICSKARYGNGCSYVGHRYYLVQWVVLIALQKLLVGFEEDDSNQKEMLSLEGELAALTANINSLNDALENTGFSESIFQRVLKMEDREKAIKARINDLRAEEASKHEAVDMQELTASINYPMQRVKLHQYLKRRLDSITVHIDKSHIDIALREGETTRLVQSPESEEWSDGKGLVFKVTQDTRWG